MRTFLITTTAMFVILFSPIQLCWAADAQSDSASQVIDASKSIVSAFAADDPDTYFDLFAPEATFIFYSTPHRLQSRSAYQREWASWRRDIDFKVLSCTSSDQRVQILGDVAILTHLVNTEIATIHGQEALQERETIVFHRRKGRWLAVHEPLSPRPKTAK